MPQTISRETFDKANAETKLGLIFDSITALHESHDEQRKSFDNQRTVCGRKIHELENGKKKNIIFSSISGAVGGFIAYFTDKF